MATGRAVGATSYWEPRCWRDEDRLDAVEVGFTWLGASAQGTGINAEAKLLLFRHAFEEWGIDCLDRFRDLDPPTQYRVLRTTPDRISLRSVPLPGFSTQDLELVRRDE